MNIEEQIQQYIDSQPEPKRKEILELHYIILTIMSECKLWFLDGKDAEGKIVSNPNIGYGSYIIKYADGKIRKFYQIGLSANTTGISIYIMGIDDKKYLSQNFGEKIGKANVTGYCIKFRKLEDINIDILKEAIQYGIETTNKKQADK